MMLMMVTSYVYLWVNGINLHLVNACLIKLDQLKVLITVKPCQLFLDSALHVYVVVSLPLVEYQP